MGMTSSTLAVWKLIAMRGEEMNDERRVKKDKRRGKS
jgi:hypothetical protein